MKVLILDKEIPYLLHGILRAQNIEVDVFAEVFEGGDPFYTAMRDHYEPRFNLCTLQEIEMRLPRYNTVLVNELPTNVFPHGISHPNVIGCVHPEIELDKVLFKKVATELGCRVPSMQDVDLHDSLPDMRNWLERDFMIKVRNQEKCGNRLFSFHAKSIRSASAFLRYCQSASGRDIGFDTDASVFIEEFIKGDEVGVGAWFDGTSFVAPYHMWFEYKKMLAHDVGPNVEELGVVCRVIPTPKRSRLCSILSRFEQYLRDIGYVGYFALNAIVTDKDVYLLECDARFPNPGLLAIAHTCNLKDLLANPKAQQSVYPERWHVCGSVVSLGFPWAHAVGQQIGGVEVSLPITCNVIPINLVDQDDWEVHRRLYKTPPPAFCDFGRIAEVIGSGETLQIARATWLSHMYNIEYPFALWRYDIGINDEKFERTIIRDYEGY